MKKDNIVLRDYHVVSGLSLTENADLLKERLPGVLCTLEGPLAGFKVPTRNNRLYPRELWLKIITSDEVQEMLDTRTFYGEGDHPFDWEQRLETHIPNVAINVRSLWIDDTSGCVMGVVDVLDTPNGRIIKTLVEYGSKVGISSRGSGSVRDVDGVPTVDVDTYQFITFDIVPMPGNKISRLTPQSSSTQVVEIANDEASMMDELTSTVNEAIEKRDVNALQSMSRLLEYSNVNGRFNSLTETISRVINESSEVESDTITQATDDLLEAYAKVSELEGTVEQLKSNEGSLQEKITYLTDLCSRSKDTILQLTESISEKDKVIESYIDLLNGVTVDNGRLSESLDKANNKVAKLTESLSTVKSECNTEKLNLQNMIASLERRVAKMTESNETKEMEVSRLKDLNESVARTKSSEVASLNESLRESRNKTNLFMKEYVKLRCNTLGISASSPKVAMMAKNQWCHQSRSVC